MEIGQASGWVSGRHTFGTVLEGRCTGIGAYVGGSACVGDGWLRTIWQVQEFVDQGTELLWIAPQVLDVTLQLCSRDSERLCRIAEVLSGIGCLSPGLVSFPRDKDCSQPLGEFWSLATNLLLEVRFELQAGLARKPRSSESPFLACGCRTILDVV